MANRSYFWGLTAILVYHLYQVNLLYNFDFDWCRQDASISQQQLRAPLPSSAAVDRGGSSTTTLITEPGGRRMQQYQLPSSRANFTCRISNVTYTFPQVPNFIVIGTQKGGTSALSALLDHHPWIESSYYFEPHFFDFNEVMNKHKNHLDDPKAMCEALKAYLLRNFNLKRFWRYPNLFAFEKTPAYVLTPNAYRRIKAVVPWAKIIVTLRNPVDRLISQHVMTYMRWWENRSFHETLAEDINVMRSEGFWLPSHDPLNSSFLGPPNQKLLKKYRTEGMLYRGLYAQQLQPWLEQYKYKEELYVVRYEELRDQPAKVLTEVLEFLGAPHYEFPEEVLSRNYSPKRITWRKSYKPDISSAVLDFLKRFYKPYNDELADLLGEEWRGVWD